MKVSGSDMEEMKVSGSDMEEMKVSGSDMEEMGVIWECYGRDGSKGE
jgi:hypothetical protein